MAARTITIEDDVYERLSRLRRDNESFSDVLRRELHADESTPVAWTGRSMQSAIESRRQPEMHLTEDELVAVEDADHSVQPPDDPWQ